LIALPDVNVLVALAWEQHVHHQTAHAWFGQSAADGWATCLLTQTAFLRLSMNPHVVHAQIDFRTALDLLDQLTSHPHHQFGTIRVSYGYRLIEPCAVNAPG
jgi:toxin-antitoxin system PIN domain toxin